MIEEKKRVSASIDHGEVAFFSDGFTISHSPSKFVFDFTQAVPRFDVIDGKMHQTINIKHKTVVMDTNMAKDFLSRFKENLSKYEKNFVKIQDPRKKLRSKNDASKPSEDTKTRYIG